MILVIFVSLFCYGFLLDGTKPPTPTTGSVLTDAHYDFVMQFVIQERQSRLQLQKEVKQLQQQLLATQTDLSNKINTLDQCTTAERNHIDNLNNKTSVLEDKLNSLTKNIDAIKLQNNQLVLENKQIRNDSKRLEIEVSNLNKLQSVSDMRVISNLQNQTNNLEQEIQETNSRQSVISSEANARKQDFIALFQKLQMTESELHSNVDRLGNKASETDKNVNNTAASLTRRIQNIETLTNNTIKKLESTF
ncbi:Hypothetical predicted protein [Mytilus galloprovincialis]|uniref:Uncharacterized protein n=1 Tax=Mytilus galloprovincialis TaxID=29158 RepID=A0A8B6BEG0_MYTGA|nr:Hypothetical predicted protein [Mytilus galloprovincialis]